MLNDSRSHGLWERSAPPAPATRALAGDLVVDVAIVGGGFTGLSAALHLAQRGLDVAVVEAVEIGYGAAGRNSGFVNAGLWVMPSALEERLGPVHGRRLLDLLGDSPRLVFDIVEKHGIACELKRAGSIHLGSGAKGVREINERARQWQALGAPVRILGAEETRAMTGTSAYPAGLLDLRAGSIQPLAYVRGLARAAMEAGAQVFTGSPVERIDREGGAWRLDTPGGTLRARWSVLSTDVYTSRIMPEVRGEQVVLPIFHVATEPLRAGVRDAVLPGGQPVWDTRAVMRILRTDNAGRLIVGSVGALRGTGAGVHRAWALRYIRSVFPQLGPIRLEHEWYGHAGMTADHLPRLYAPAENMIMVGAYNGRGIAPGTVFGREIARHVLGETTLDDMALPVSRTGTARFRRAKETFYEAGAQVAHLPPLQ